MRRLRRFGFNRIKEGFDQLPTAVCFFDSRGGIVLCNRQMYRLSHYLFESDMQYLGGTCFSTGRYSAVFEYGKYVSFSG